MIYFDLIREFFKIGLFSFGGGYATIPFLYHISEQYGWYSIKQLTDMIAVASVTPGPVGVNVATFAGLKTAGIFGAMLATVFEMLPSLILVIVIAKILDKFSNNFYVKAIVASLKPIGCALLLSVAVGLIKPYLFDVKAWILLAVFILVSLKSKKSPLFYILISGIVGIVITAFSVS